MFDGSYAVPDAKFFVSMIPSGFRFSDAVEKASKEYREAVARKTQYEAENADHATSVGIPHRNFPHCWRGENEQLYTTRALINAEANLKDAYLKAVEEGKAFPDSDEFYGPALKGREEYLKALEAFELVINKAANKYRSLILNEIDDLAVQAIRDADEAKAEYVEAEAAFRRAQAKLAGAVDRFAFAGSGGRIHSRNGIGVRGTGGPELWETRDGRITPELARALRLTANGSAVDIAIRPRYLVGGESVTKEE